jgi:hypothetical protein
MSLLWWAQLGKSLDQAVPVAAVAATTPLSMTALPIGSLGCLLLVRVHSSRVPRAAFEAYLALHTEFHRCLGKAHEFSLVS